MASKSTVCAAIVLASAASLLAHTPPPKELLDLKLKPGQKPAQAKEAQGAPVRVETELSQTAIWKGDQFQYRITLVHPPEVEIVRDNLKAEGLNVEPFVLLGLESVARSAAGARILELRLKLALLEGTAGEAAIPPLTIYYATRKAGPLGKGTDIETHSLVIPEKVVGVATTLTKDSRDIRDSAGAFPVRRGGREIALLGWGMLGLVAAQGGYSAVAYYRRRSKANAKRDRRVVVRQALERLDRLDEDSGRDGALAERCGEMASTLREALAEVTGIEATNLTPREIKADLLRIKAGEPFADSVHDLLTECQQIRYRRPGSVNGGRKFSDLIESSRSAVSELTRL